MLNLPVAGVISPGFSPRDIIASGLASQEANKSDYYRNPDAEGKWWWHASSLGRCPRRLILDRAGLAADGSPLEGLMTMQVGTWMHQQFEGWIRAYVEGRKDIEITAQERPFFHSQYPMCAKPDVLLQIPQGFFLIDFKTEHENAAKRRGEDAREVGRYTSAKADHMIQLAATAMCIEDTLGIAITSGAIWYVSKNNGWIESAPVDLSEAVLREDVLFRVNALEQYWRLWSGGRELPRKLNQEDRSVAWECQPVKGSELGRYCPARSTCMGAGMPA